MSAILSIIVRPAVKKLGGFLRLLIAWCEGIAGYVFRRSAIASLGEFDNRALRDIGLERSQIQAAVYGYVTLRNREKV